MTMKILRGLGWLKNKLFQQNPSREREKTRENTQFWSEKNSKDFKRKKKQNSSFGSKQLFWKADAFLQPNKAIDQQWNKLRIKISLVLECNINSNK